MYKLYIVMGKSATGKDTVFKLLKGASELSLNTVVTYTTRPIRQGETEGVEYHFVEVRDLNQLNEEKKIIEQRAYHTIYGIWNYFTVDDGQIDLEQSDYLLIGTLESYQQIREYYGSQIVEPIYIEVEDGIRLGRALNRERQQDIPKYDEMCRRFLADQEDFSEDNLKALGVVKRYQNIDLEECLEQIIKDILVTRG